MYLLKEQSEMKVHRSWIKATKAVVSKPGKSSLENPGLNETKNHDHTIGLHCSTK